MPAARPCCVKPGVLLQRMIASKRMSVPLGLSSQDTQNISHYPAIPPPVPVDLWSSPPHPCPYLPGRMATMRAVMSNQVAPEIYHQFMDSNFRRSGRVIYQPTCAGCRQCQSLRVIVDRFRPTKSQRRCWRKNSELLVTMGSLQATEEKFGMYQKYLNE